MLRQFAQTVQQQPLPPEASMYRFDGGRVWAWFAPAQVRRELEAIYINGRTPTANPRHTDGREYFCIGNLVGMTCWAGQPELSGSD